MTQRIQSAPWWREFLPPSEVIWEWVIGAVIAFIVVQFLKSWRRYAVRKSGKRNLHRFSTFEMMGITVLVTLPCVFLQLRFVHGHTLIHAALYAAQGAVVAPMMITALLEVLGRFLPGLKEKLAQDARRARPSQQGPPPGTGDRRARRRDDPDETTGNWL